MRNCFRHRGFKVGSEDIAEREVEVTTDSVAEEAVKRGIVPASLFEEYTNMYNKARTSDVTTHADINGESKKEKGNIIETDDEDADHEPQSLVA